MPKKKTAKSKVETVTQKLETMTHVDGKDYGKQRLIEVSKKKTLNEIWCRKFSQFKTSDPKVYLANIRAQTKLELQQECIRIGLMPHDNRELMIERLLKEFNKYIAAARTSSLQPQPIKLSAASRQILGRAANLLI